MERSLYLFCLVALFIFICKCNALPAVSDNDFRSMKTRFERFVLLQGQQIKQLQETVAKLEAKLGQEAKATADLKDEYDSKLKAAVDRLESESLAKADMAVAKMQIMMAEQVSKLRQDHEQVQASVTNLESKLQEQIEGEAAKAAFNSEQLSESKLNTAVDTLQETISELGKKLEQKINELEEKQNENQAAAGGNEGLETKMAAAIEATEDLGNWRLNAAVERLETALTGKIQQAVEQVESKLSQKISDETSRVSQNNRESSDSQLANAVEGLENSVLDKFNSTLQSANAELESTLDQKIVATNEQVGDLKSAIERLEDTTTTLLQVAKMDHEQRVDKEVARFEQVIQTVQSNDWKLAEEMQLMEKAMLDHVESAINNLEYKLEQAIGDETNKTAVTSKDHSDSTLAEAVKTLENHVAETLEKTINDIEAKFEDRIASEAAKVANMTRADDSKLAQSVDHLGSNMTQLLQETINKMEAKLEERIGQEKAMAQELGNSKLAAAVANLENSMADKLDEAIGDLEQKLEQRIIEETNKVSVNNGDDNLKLVGAMEALKDSMTDKLRESAKELQAKLDQKIREETTKVYRLAERDGNSKLAAAVTRMKDTMTQKLHEAIGDLEAKLDQKIRDETSKLVGAGDHDSKLSEAVDLLKETMSQKLHEAVGDLEAKLVEKISEETTKVISVTEENTDSKVTSALERLQKDVMEMMQEAVAQLESKQEQRIGEEANKVVLNVEEKNDSKLAAAVERLKENFVAMLQDVVAKMDAKLEERITEVKVTPAAPDTLAVTEPETVTSSPDEATVLAKETEDLVNSNLSEAVDSLQNNIVEMLKDAIAKMEAKLEAKIRQGAATKESSKYLSNCHEIKENDPSKRSGMYWIDPDGQGVGEEPIEVWCDLIAGVTMVSHDSEDSIKVKRCHRPGCYSRPIVYNASMNQIVALIQRSTHCRQSIQYDCFAAPLYFNGVSQSWWNDRNGQVQNYWEGSNSGQHVCKCGVDGDCVDSSMMCNCDSTFPMRLSDFGWITNKTALPVTKLNFGRTKSSMSSGEHRLGLLECSGLETSSPVPSSCEDLKIHGHMLSGIYTVKTEEGLRNVFCNMAKLPGDQALETVVDADSNLVKKGKDYETNQGIIYFYKDDLPNPSSRGSSD